MNWHALKENLLWFLDLHPTLGLALVWGFGIFFAWITLVFIGSIWYEIDMSRSHKRRVRRELEAKTVNWRDLDTRTKQQTPES